MGECVQPQDAVIVDFVGRLDGPDGRSGGPVFHDVQDWILVVGEKDVVPALEMGIRFMREGETAVIQSHSKFAYGPSARGWMDYTLPAHSAVEYTVTVKHIVPPAEAERRRFQLRLCLSKKTMANDIYKNDEIRTNAYAKSRALHIYQRAAGMLDYMLQSEVDEGDAFDRRDARACLLDCLNNAAAVHLQCQSYHAAKEASVRVLEKDPANVKALLRAAKAALLDPASSYDEVDAAIVAAAAQCQNNNNGDGHGDDGGMMADVNALRADFARRKSAYQRREKELYAKMAAATITATTTTTNTTATPATATAAKDKPMDAASAATNGNTANESVDTDRSSSSQVVEPDNIPYWKALPWRTLIIPYGTQLLLPFVLYYFFTLMKQTSSYRLDDDDAAAAVVGGGSGDGGLGRGEL